MGDIGRERRQAEFQPLDVPADRYEVPDDPAQPTRAPAHRHDEAGSGARAVPGGAT